MRVSTVLGVSADLSLMTKNQTEQHLITLKNLVYFEQCKHKNPATGLPFHASGPKDAFGKDLTRPMFEKLDALLAKIVDEGLTPADVTSERDRVDRHFTTKFSAP